MNFLGKIIGLINGDSLFERMRKSENFYVLCDMDTAKPYVIQDKNKQMQSVLVFEDVKKAKAFVKKYKGSGNKYEVVKSDVEYLDTFLREAHAMGIETLLIGKNRKARGYDISGLMEKLKEFAT